MISCVLLNWHTMFGMDFHSGNSLPVPPAAPIAFGPNAVVPTPLYFGPWGAFTGRPTLEVFGPASGTVMQQGTDIGPLIIHIPIPFNILLPLIIMGSASKSYFGVASVQTGGLKGTAPVAVAVMQVMNLNLNCGTVPTPTGIVLTPNTVNALFTLGDFVSGLVTMLIEGAIQAALNLFFDKGLGGLANGIFGKAVMETLGPLLASNLVGTALGLLAGSPLGASGSDLDGDFTSPVGKASGDFAGDTGKAAGNAVNKMLNNPNIEQHPSGTGAGPGTASPGTASPGAASPGAQRLN